MPPPYEAHDDHPTRSTYPMTKYLTAARTWVAGMLAAAERGMDAAWERVAGKRPEPSDTEPDERPEPEPAPVPAPSPMFGPRRRGPFGGPPAPSRTDIWVGPSRDEWEAVQAELAAYRELRRRCADAVVSSRWVRVEDTSTEKVPEHRRYVIVGQQFDSGRVHAVRAALDRFGAEWPDGSVSPGRRVRLRAVG